ncbi:DUF3099 domain-containing protein [Georgenia faecalis]|uniref:DUF3099 domain-containing protein n=1 Tax=Georgenia faecalis TaxID=2483799 RepID=A0ABV9DCQ1_9MICO|nr:DUF3099 domain-containing protein [Georgenia faecalis]
MRTSRGRRGRDEQVHSITSVRRALAEDVHDRTVRYLISMTVRTLCVFGAAFTEGWIRWVLVAGAVVLPYIAVVAANAGRERPKPGGSAPDARPDLPALGGPGPGPGDPPPPPFTLPEGGYLR